MKPNTVKSSIIIVILISLLLAGCSGSSSPSASSANSKVDPCALLTKADAEKIEAKPVKDATHPITASQTFDVSSCAYQIDGGSALDKASLIVTVPVPPDVKTAKTSYDTGKNTAQSNWNASPLDVPGVGDAAYWVGGSGNNITVIKGSYVFTLTASTQKGDAPTATIIDLAKTVVSRLQ
jgi:hypothetical protein